MKMLAVLTAAAALTAAPDYAQAVALVQADYKAYGSSARYLDFGAYPPEIAQNANTAWKFFYPHLDRSTSLSHRFPLIAASIVRVDIDALGWGRKGWVAALRGYPYANYEHGDDLLIARADWLLAYGADASRVTIDGKPNDVYEGLLFAGDIPKNKTDWLSRFGIKYDNEELIQAQVIDKSGVAFGRRLAVFRPDARDWFETFDSRRPAGKNDPALGIDQFKFDAQEIIVELPKVLPTASYARVRVQAYVLTDGRGDIADFAANDIVEDHRRFANRASVRTPGSCIACHTAGLNGSTSNVFREYLQAPGIPQLLVKDQKKAAAFDSLYLGSIGKIVRRANEDVAEFALDYVGEEPKSAVNVWSDVVSWYDEPLNLVQAARELHCDATDMRLALGYYNAAYGPQEQFLDAAGLAHGRTVSRVQWEERVFDQCGKALNLWRAKK